MMVEAKNDQRFLEACNELLKEISCDFVGLAIQNQRGPDIKWHFAVGNQNEKYKRITVRYGKGIAGKVILTGSPMSINQFPEQILGKAIEYPIMLAEKLVTSYGVPILCKGSPKGVLLVGRRKALPFLENEQQLVQKAAGNMEELLSDLLICHCERSSSQEGEG
jgi:nitrogen regulatory protein A